MNKSWNLKHCICTWSGRRNTTPPKTMTFPDSSNALANSTPISRSPHTSPQIRTNSPCEIVLAGIFLSLSLIFSANTNLSTLFASAAPTRNRSSSAGVGIGVLSPSKRRRWSPVRFMDLSFSRSFSPEGSVRNEGRELGEEWLLMARRWRKRRKKPAVAESGEVMYSRW